MGMFLQDKLHLANNERFFLISYKFEVDESIIERRCKSILYSNNFYDICLLEFL